MEYLTDNEIQYRYQSEFCKNHSIDTCLSYLTGKILTGFDSRLLTGMILIDLQQAPRHHKPRYFIEKNVFGWIFLSIHYIV